MGDFVCRFARYDLRVGRFASLAGVGFEGFERGEFVWTFGVEEANEVRFFARTGLPSWDCVYAALVRRVAP